MKRTTIVAVVMLLTLTSCSRFSHNLTGMFFGTRVSIGNIEYGEIAFLHGFAFIDASRENSSWSLEIDKEDGLSFTDGRLKGVTRISRTIGKQITGYLTDLAEVDQDAANAWTGGKGEGSKKDEGGDK